MFQARLFKEHLGQMIASQWISSYRSLPYDSFYDKNGTANLLEQLASTDHEKKDSFDQWLLAILEQKAIFHFLSHFKMFTHPCQL